MKNTLNIALFDLDNSLADYESAMLRDLRSLRSPTEPEITAENLWDYEIDHIAKRMWFIKNSPGWWRDLLPLPLGIQIFNLAEQMGFHNQILTKGPKKHPVAWAEKVEWCQHHLGTDTDIHVVSDKSGQYGKLLYDDYPDYMEAWLEHRPRGLGIMPTTASNKKWTHPQVIKWDGTNLEQVKNAMSAALERRPGERRDFQRKLSEKS